MKKYWILFFCLLLLPFSVEAKTKATLKECIDGDTAKFQIENETYTARFLAIDAPEIKHGKNKADPYGDEAKEFTCNELKNAKNIRLEYDEHSDKKDKYDRILVWVWVDDQLLQEELIKKGYAKVAYLYGDYKYTETLKEQEAKARKKGVGIWGTNEKPLEFNEQTTLIIGIAAVLITIFLFLFSKSFRKKTIKKTTNKLEKSIKKQFEKKV